MKNASVAQERPGVGAEDAVIRPQPSREVPAKRVLAASFAGTAIEYFDFYLYGIAAALVFGPVFFPKAANGAQQLEALTAFSLAYLARPLGAVLFGHLGDRIGRKATLVAALLIMGGSTVLIGCLPTYASVGWWAPAALCLLRFGQGIGFGGEWGGAVLLAVENAPASERAWYGTFPQVGPPVGILLANLCLLALTFGLTPAAFLSWGWRLPFLGSAVLVALGLYVRLNLEETTAFAAALAAAPPERVPLTTVLRRHGGAVLVGGLASANIPVLAYTFGVFAVDYGARVLGYDHPTLLLLESAAALFNVAGLILCGRAANRFGLRPVLLAALSACTGLALLGPAIGASTAGASAWPYMLGALCLGFLTLGCIAAPMGTILSELFPTRVRYTGTAVAFNLGGVLGGVSAPYLTHALATARGIGSVGIYLAGASALGFVAVLVMGEDGRRQAGAEGYNG